MKRQFWRKWMHLSSFSRWSILILFWKLCLKLRNCVRFAAICNGWFWLSNNDMVICKDRQHWLSKVPLERVKVNDKIVKWINSPASNGTSSHGHIWASTNIIASPIRELLVFFSYNIPLQFNVVVWFTWMFVFWISSWNCELLYLGLGVTGPWELGWGRGAIVYCISLS